MKELSNQVFYTGVLDAELDYFDIIIKTVNGTSYNSYFVKGEKTALIDAVKFNFTEEFIEKLEKICPLSTLDYIVMNHTEPDHSGALRRLLEKAPQATIVTSRFAATLIKEILNRDFPCQIVGDGDELDLGGKTLQFISAPFLHWPDTQFTYLKEDEILFPCDFFGCHYGDSDYLDYKSGKEKLRHFQQYYLDSIMDPFRNYALEALEKIKDLKIKMIAPSHGPVLTTDIEETIQWFKDWALEIEEKNDPKVAYVAYVSCYGYTEKLANAIGEGVASTGVKALVKDVAELPRDQVMKALKKADGIALGSPTFNRDALEPIWELTNGLTPYTSRGKKAVSFGSFGWSGEASVYLGERLKNLGFQLIGTTRSKMLPDENALKEAYDLGVALGQSILEEK